MAREFSGFVTLHPWPAKVWSATTLVAIIRILLTKPYTPINGVMSTLYDQDACGSFIRAERHRPHSQSQGSSVIGHRRCFNVVVLSEASFDIT
jgi:hypothetical protein